MLLKKIFCALFTVLMFLTFSEATNAAALNSDKVPDTKSPYLYINAIDITNFDKVDNYYYRGAQPDYCDIKTLSALGIKTIINLRMVYPYSKYEFLKQRQLAESYGMNYINIPMRPDIPPTYKQISDFFRIINNSKNLPVFVHCAQGKDRTGIMTALYRVKKYGWNYTQAYSEMKQKGYHSILFPKQKRFLATFIESLQANADKNLTANKNF